MVQLANLFFHLSFPPRFRSPPVCTWKPRTVFFSVSCSDALPGSQWSPPLSSSKEQFSFSWEDYGLFPSSWDPTAGSNGMNITVKVLSPLDPRGEFAPVQEAFTTTVSSHTYQTHIYRVSNPVSASGTNPWLSLAALGKGNPEHLGEWQSLPALLLEQDSGMRWGSAMSCVCSAAPAGTALLPLELSLCLPTRKILSKMPHKWQEKSHSLP